MTKKEHIIHLAQDDPFLRVEEIAALVGTTPRYVRTILSEARLSLMELRRNYVRDIERDVKSDVAVGQDEEAVWSDDEADHQQPSQDFTIDGALQIMETVDRQMNDALRVDSSQPLIKLSRIRSVGDKPFYLEEIVTHKEITVGKHMMTDAKPLRQLLGLEQPGTTEFIQQYIEVERAVDHLAAHLRLSKGSPVFKLSRIVKTNGERVAVEIHYCDALHVRINLDRSDADPYVISPQVDVS